MILISHPDNSDLPLGVVGDIQSLLLNESFMVALSKVNLAYVNAHMGWRLYGGTKRRLKLNYNLLQLMYT